MFEYEWSALDEKATLAAAVDNEHTLHAGELLQLQLAAHWADLHPGAAVDPAGLPGRERRCCSVGTALLRWGRSPPLTSAPSSG